MKSYKSAFDAIFEDDKELAENLKIRAQLLTALEEFINKNFSSQKEAKEFFSESQPTISAIVNGKYENFTIDKLVQLSTKAGIGITVKTTKPKKVAKVA
jgi:predicted XRE-type DNA-binding protein